MELQIFDILWSEHCSYKSSRTALKNPARRGPDGPDGAGGGRGHRPLRRARGEEVRRRHRPREPQPPLPGGAGRGGGDRHRRHRAGRLLHGRRGDRRARSAPLRRPERAERAERSIEIARGVVEGDRHVRERPRRAEPRRRRRLRSGPSTTTAWSTWSPSGSSGRTTCIRSACPRRREEPYVFILVGKPTDSTGLRRRHLRLGGPRRRGGGGEQGGGPGARPVPEAGAQRGALRAPRAGPREGRSRSGCKDLGAGGIACMASELADRGGMGVETRLDAIPLAEDQDLPPWVALVLGDAGALRPGRAARASPRRPCALFNERVRAPARSTGGPGRRWSGASPRSGVCRSSAKGEVLCDADVEAITCGDPRRAGTARRRPRGPARRSAAPYDGDPAEALLRMLASPNGGSAEPIYRSYDTEVQARAVIRPGEGGRDGDPPRAGVRRAGSRRRSTAIRGTGSSIPARRGRWPSSRGRATWPPSAPNRSA